MLKRKRVLLRTVVKQTLKDVQRGWKRRARRKTGAMARSARVVMLPGVGGMVIVGAPYALIEEKGTRKKDYPITPRRAGGVLRFYWPKVGKVVHLKRVKHPGVKGSFAMSRSLQAERRRFEARVRGILGGQVTFR